MPYIDPAYVHRYALPALLVRGVDSGVEVDVRDRAGVAVTPGAGTISVFRSGVAVVSEAAISLGSPSSYTIAAATTAAESLSTEWLVRWDLTVGGAPLTLTQPANVVLYRPVECITDADLVALHTDIADLRDPTQTDYSEQRGVAWIRLTKLLMQHGTWNHRVFDRWQLSDLHKALTLSIIFRDFASSTNADGRYSELAEFYDGMAREEFERLNLRVDSDDSGTIGADEGTSHPPVLLSRPWRPGVWRW